MANLARRALVAAALAMGLVEIVAVFVESPYALILAALLFLGAGWLWLRPRSLWPILAVAVLFILELVYLSDYDWNDSSDRTLIILTVAICSLGLIAVVASLLGRGSKQ
jgi:hypothetical protein